MPSLTLTDTTIIDRKGSVIATQDTDEAILLDIDSGYFFQLNRTAARIWGLLEAPMALTDLRANLQRDFDVMNVDLNAEVDAFVLDLAERGIVTTR